jgi:hypothetical protein
VITLSPHPTRLFRPLFSRGGDMDKQISSDGDDLDKAGSVPADLAVEIDPVRARAF